MEETIHIYTKIFSNVNLQMIWAVIETNPLLPVLLIMGYGLTLLPVKWKDNLIKNYTRMDFYLKIIFLIITIQMMLQMKSSVVQPFIYFQF